VKRPQHYELSFEMLARQEEWEPCTMLLVLNSSLWSLLQMHHLRHIVVNQDKFVFDTIGGGSGKREAAEVTALSKQLREPKVVMRAKVM
jgi:hypothetical protein